MVAPIVGEFAFVVTSLLDDLVFVLASPIDELGTAFANACSVISHPVRRKVLVILTEREAASTKGYRSRTPSGSMYCSTTITCPNSTNTST
jgi:hypothetical protein